jgi:uncharacterized protein
MEFTVIKKNIKGEETWRYKGREVERGADCIVIEAYFDREDTEFYGMVLAKGDQFIETWYTDRWYNIFEIHSREDGRLRGWYCNIGCPAEIAGNVISYIDLSLDLLVFPDRRQVVLDEDEFAELEISAETRRQALAALEELKGLFSSTGGVIPL